MTTALVVSSARPDTPALAAELTTLGIHVIGAVQRDTLVRDAAKLAPDVVVCFESSPDDGFFNATSLLAATAPCAVLVFAQDGDANKIERSVACGIHAYVVNGYSTARLRSLIHLALARYRHDQRLRSDLEDIGLRLEERKLVDRAKGILMRARQIQEDEAFKVLRTASMHANQRVGEISRQVIAAANEADAVNRSGQLRMLSQRLVKLYAQGALDVQARACTVRIDESARRGDANLETLQRILSNATFGDLLEAVLGPWRTLRNAAGGGFETDRVAEIDRLAERLLVQADQLTCNLETSGVAPSLEVINVSGRQRMLTQRLAKQALLGALRPEGEDPGAACLSMAQTQAAFKQAMAYLRGVPLSTARTRQLLDEADSAWEAMVAAVPAVRTPSARGAVVEESENLLVLFDELTAQYERSMQVLLG